MIIDPENAVIDNGEIKSNQLMFNHEFDFSDCSLIETMMGIESELTGVSIKKIQGELNLQHIIITSKLTHFVEADQDKLNALIKIVYSEQGFCGDWKTFFKVENTLISRVLSRRKGIPISLGMLFLDLLEISGFSAQGICFPSGFLIRIDVLGDVVYFDPFTGELPSYSDLELKVRGQLGNYAKLKAKMLNPDTNKTIIKRLINVVKAAYIQADKLAEALLCSDMLLRIDPDDAYEVRDRGFIFQALDCFKLASSDFAFFIEQFPEDPIVGLLKQQIKQMNIDEDAQIIH